MRSNLLPTPTHSPATYAPLLRVRLTSDAFIATTDVIAQGITEAIHATVADSIVGEISVDLNEATGVAESAVLVRIDGDSQTTLGSDISFTLAMLTDLETSIANSLAQRDVETSSVEVGMDGLKSLSTTDDTTGVCTFAGYILMRAVSLLRQRNSQRSHCLCVGPRHLWVSTRTAGVL